MAVPEAIAQVKCLEQKFAESGPCIISTTNPRGTIFLVLNSETAKKKKALRIPFKDIDGENETSQVTLWQDLAKVID